MSRQFAVGKHKHMICNWLFNKPTANCQLLLPFFSEPAKKQHRQQAQHKPTNAI